ncbi:MAG TPA: hypothetical protein VFE98_03190 [Candidatus Bathyarchaeia archaeon]|nr:hypothetical protein [Candidatus Bathyarchaeia archaeon]
MGFLPEFFLVLGIVIFLATSLLCALLGEDLPSILQYLFQGTAILGLGVLLMNQGLSASGVFGRGPTDPTRFWISIVYLGLAVSSVVGLNVYLAVVRRNIALASMFSGMVTVPTFMISAILVSSFVATGGEVSLTTSTIFILTLSVFVISVSVFGFLREASKHLRKASIGLLSSPTVLVSMPPYVPGTSLPSQQVPPKGKDEWEESSRKKRR